MRWEIDEPLVAPAADSPFASLQMSHCHCSRCRKAHGAPYATYLMVREEQFRITHGEDQIERYPSSDMMARPFCRTCGSTVPDGNAWQGWAGTPVGPFDDDPSLRPQCHIFTASNAPWMPITDALPQHETYPPSVPAMPVLPTRAPLDPEGLGARGSCLCGAVTFVVDKPAIRCRSCHCSRCRKAMSAAFGTYLVTPLDGARFTRGEALVRRYKVPEAEFFSTCFCGVCGSPTARRDEGRGLCIIPFGAFDDDPGARPGSHIFVGSKAGWDEITDGLPAYDTLPS